MTSRQESGKLSPEVEEMLRFGEYVFIDGLEKLRYCEEHAGEFIHKRHKLIAEKRLSVVNLIHGAELIFKAILIKNQYYIKEIKRNITPLEWGLSVEDILDENRTIRFSDVIPFLRRRYPEINFDDIKTLNEIRNEIQHRGTRIRKKKRALFEGTVRMMLELYKEEFPRKRNLPRKLSEFLERG